MIKTKKAAQAWLVFYLALAAGAVLLFATRSSILYPYNNWDDANSYLSMGKSMFAGKVIYRDLFDQKGPYLYFFYGLCSLVSRTDFRGVFLMEWLLAAIDLFLAFRILLLYAPDSAGRNDEGTAFPDPYRIICLLLLPFLLFACFTSRSFYWGGAAEEICLPFMLAVLYISLSHERLQPDKPYSWREIAVSGFCSGVVACIKFTVLGFFFAFMVMVLLHAGKLSRFLKSCAVFLLFMALPALPWIVYFGALGALDDFYRVYIYTNVFLYSSFGANSKGEGLYDKVYNLAKLLYWLFLDDIRYFALIALGMLGFLVRRKSDIRERICVPVFFLFTFLGIFIGGSNLPYYSLPLTVFACPGAAVLSSLLYALYPKKRLEAQNTGSAGGTLALAALGTAVLLGGALSFFLTPNRYYLSYTKDDVFLTRFTEDIRNGGIDHPTLLNYGCLDCGLYTTADIVPSCYWFQSQTLPTPEVELEQLTYIEEGRTDYLVVRGDIPLPDMTSVHYREIDRFHQVMGDLEFDYTLFQKR